MKSIFITGVSSGIGYELAIKFLDLGYSVYGISRRIPMMLIHNPNFYHMCIDVSDIDNLGNKISKFLFTKLKLTKIDYIFLNAGEFNQRIAPISETPIAEYIYLMNVNTWSCKIILDILLRSRVILDTIVFSSSIAGKRARKGMGAYAVSKAALNILAELYALDNPNLYFLVLGLCNVDTFLGKSVLSLPLIGEFNDMVALRKRAIEPGYIVSADIRANQILDIVQKLDRDDKGFSGKFIDIRSLINKI